MHCAEATDPISENTADERMMSNENEIQVQLSRQRSAKDIESRVRKRQRRKVCFFVIAGIAFAAAFAAGIAIAVAKRRKNNQSSTANSNTSESSDAPPPTLYDMCLVSAESKYVAQHKTTCEKDPNEGKYEDGIFSYGTTGSESNDGGRWAKLAEAIQGEAGGDNSGLAIDMSCDGSIVAIGALLNDAGDSNNTPNIGHARVFELNQKSKSDGTIDLTWKQLGDDIDGAAAHDRFGGALSLSADGRRIAVGAIGSDASDETTSTGLVQVYDYRMGSWIKLADDLQGTEKSQLFGRSVSLSANGMRLAVGSSGTDLQETNEDNVGMIQVFELDDNNSWQNVGDEIYGAHGASTYFGRSVSLSGDGSTLAVGGFGGNHGGMEDTGIVQVYKWKKELMIWAQQGRDLHGKGKGDWFGLSVALNYDGTRVAVGAPGDNSMWHIVPGYTMVFEQSSTNEWKQLGQDLEGGYSVSISFDGAQVAAASYKHVETGINSGGVRTYRYQGGTGDAPLWIPTGQNINGESRSMFGSSVAISSDGKRIVSGAPASSGVDGQLQTGSCQVYEWCGI